MARGLKRAAGFVVYRKNPAKTIEYLLMQASYGNHHWSPPKGHIEEDECELDAAVRETDEETGITMSDLRIHLNFEKMLTYDPEDKPFRKQVVYWLACLINPDTPVILSDEHQDYKWLPLAEAKHLAAYPELQDLLDDCENHLSRPNVNK